MYMWSVEETDELERQAYEEYLYKLGVITDDELCEEFAAVRI